jgi:hypothetical protein
MAVTALAQSREKPKKDNKAQCESYQRQLDANAASARKGGNAKAMERLSEQRRHISASQRKAGC